MAPLACAPGVGNSPFHSQVTSKSTCGLNAKHQAQRGAEVAQRHTANHSFLHSAHPFWVSPKCQSLPWLLGTQR